MKSRKVSFERLEARHALSSPQIASPFALRVNEDTPTPAVVRVSDRDSNQITVRLEVSAGTLAHSPNHNAVASTNGSSITARGTKKNVNELLKSVVYQPPKDSNAPETMTVTASDGQKTSKRTTQIKITPVNDAPNIEVSGFASLDGTLLKGVKISVADPDSNRIRVSIATNNGTVLSSHPSATNLGNRVTFEGSRREVRTFLSDPNSIEVRPADQSDFEIRFAATDGMARSAKTIAVSQKESLEDHATKQVESRLNGKDPASSKRIFSLMDHGKAEYERNPQVWTQDLDLTPISPWNSAGGNRLAGTLVSPRHIVYATHYQMPVGTKIRFITKDNEVVERTLSAKISPPFMYSSYFPDITVGVLDSDVPDSIGFAKILPENWSQHLNPNGFRIPSLALDQEEKALVSDLFYLNQSAGFTQSTKEPNKGFFETIIAGDSGNPAFMVVNRELVLITVWTWGGGGAGTFITHQKNEINRMMAELGGGYQLTEVDLGGFRRF